MERHTEMRKENLKLKIIFVKMQEKKYFFIMDWKKKSYFEISKEFGILCTVLPILWHTWKNKVWKKEKHSQGEHFYAERVREARSQAKILWQ